MGSQYPTTGTYKLVPGATRESQQHAYRAGAHCLSQDLRHIVLSDSSSGIPYLASVGNMPAYHCSSM